MKIFLDLKDIPLPPKPIALTIGTFDGVHEGHRTLFRHCRKCTGPSGTVALLTYPNHPYTVLTGTPIPAITPLKQKLALFEKDHIDLAIVLEFTLDFAALPYDIFLRQLRAAVPFDYLVLGDGATLGKDRAGDAAHLAPLATEFNFTLEYLPKLTDDQQIPISSKRIRTLLQAGQFLEAEKYLGHPFTLTIIPEKEKEGGDKHALLCTFANDCKLPNGIYNACIDNTLSCQAKVETGDPSYITLYTDSPLDPEIPHELHFIAKN